ncbi:MAG: hypothetical protein ACP6IP_05870 [Candidatus Njordarchaeia archaeon]
MPGHLVRILVYNGFRDVFSSLVKEFGNIFHYVLFNREGKRVGIILGEKLFLWRTGSDVGLFILIEEIGEKRCELFILSYAGGAGLLHISWDAHPEYVRRVLRFLRRNGFTYDRISEINYFDSEKIPEDVREKVEEALKSDSSFS